MLTIAAQSSTVKAIFNVVPLPDRMVTDSATQFAIKSGVSNVPHLKFVDLV